MTTEPDAAVTRVVASCLGAAAAIEVHDPLTGKTLGRSVSLNEEAPTGRARLLALAIAELIAASWTELESNPRPRVPPAVLVAPPAAREAARAALAGRSIQLAAVFDTHLMASADWLFGGGARASVRISRLLFLQVDALADYGQLDRPTGTVGVVMPSGSAALGVSRWTSAALRPALSVGLRAGYVWMNGVPAGGAAVSAHQQGVWLGPEASLQVSAWASARVHPVVGLTAGAHLLGVRGTVNDGRDVEAVGLWGGVNAAVALQ